MAELKKLDENELDAVSGGTKYNVGNNIDVYSRPGAGYMITLTPGDFFVTDGTISWVNGTPWSHVYTAYGNGYICGAL